MLQHWPRSHYLACSIVRPAVFEMFSQQKDLAWRQICKFNVFLSLSIQKQAVKLSKKHSEYGYICACCSSHVITITYKDHYMVKKVLFSLCSEISPNHGKHQRKCLKGRIWGCTHIYIYYFLGLTYIYICFSRNRLFFLPHLATSMWISRGRIEKSISRGHCGTGNYHLLLNF